MGINTSDTSKSYDGDSILNHIINCANCALQDTDSFQKAMDELSAELRAIFDSEYCSIGTISNGYAEESIFSFETFNDKRLYERQERSLEAVKRVNINDDSSTVSLALRSNEQISWFYPSRMNGLGSVKGYKNYILPSRDIKNVCVIPIRDKANQNFGFIQLINVKNQIDYDHDVSPYMRALLGLVQIIINKQKNQQELEKRDNRLRDADFYNFMQNKKDDVDALLDSIMSYFSIEFNAAVVSFRIPLLNGYNNDLLFYLRRVFVHQSIGDSKHHELLRRYEKKQTVMPEVGNEIRCNHQGKIIESKSTADFSEYGLNLDDNTLIMPIFRDSDNHKCIHPSRKQDAYCKLLEHRKCTYRFKRLYGIFRLRISKSDLLESGGSYHFDLEETKERLAYLSNQITLLLNSIVDRHENESLQKFQYELKNTSFIKIQDFDKRCVDIIQQSAHAKVCSIYRYDEQSKYLSLSATTARIIHFKTKDNDLYFEPERIKDSCFISTSVSNNLLAQAFKTKSCLYVLNIRDTQIHNSPFIEFIKSDQESAMAIPMIKKDGTCAGVVFLIGKEGHNHSISTTYWEHDIKGIEFIVSILTRISESDTERLTFLSQLAHEMLAPVTELVYDNDLTVSIAERNYDSISKRQLISKLRENIDRNMLFKYIISDTEFIYSTAGRRIEYNIVKQKKPQAILLDAIRLMEKDAHAKGLSITTHIKQMPPLYFDKERMMQVFINLLKNAIRYSDNRSTINISYNNRSDGFHEISFANDGIGVQKDEKESIFELFHRGEAAKKKFSRGVGMGLFITRDIMRMHGGDCYVKKTENPTEFVITLPNKE